MVQIKFNETSYKELMKHIENDMKTEDWKRNLYKINITSKFAIEGAISEELAKKTIIDAIQK